MGDVVNLRRARKQRGRAEAARTAAENRVAHGRSKAERTASDTVRAADERKLDGHCLGDDDGSDEA